MRPTYTKVFLSIALGILLVLPILVLAQQSPGPLPGPGLAGLEQASAIPGQAGLALTALDPRIIVAKIIRTALGFLGIVAIVLILYGGYLWMTSAGNEETIAKAKKVLINGTIGLAIILSAFAITQFILNKLLADQAAPPLPPPSAAPARIGGGALGSGIIESHYPLRGARGVYRNTRIIITFKEAIDPASLATTTATNTDSTPKYFDAVDYESDGVIDERNAVAGLILRTEAIQIIRTSDLEGLVRDADNADKYLQNVGVSFTDDLKTFVFDPVDLLGSATDNVSYTIYLCGTNSRPGNCAAGGLKFVTSQSAFQGYFKDYQWSFETGTVVDITPPKITSVIPAPAAVGRPRNTMVQVNFNEPVLPTVAAGKTVIAVPPGQSGPRPTRGTQIQPGAYQIMSIKAGGDFLAGQWQLGNQYRTAEFTSTDLCGRNSCGQDVFCLPGNATVQAEVLAATLLQAGDPASAGLFDGIEDIAGNSLDGNGNDRAQGPPADNAAWSFSTSNTILLGSAVITETRPQTSYGVFTSGVPPALDPLAMDFDRAMAMTTFTSTNIILAGTDRITGGIWDTWWTLAGENLKDTRPPAQQYGRSRALINHGGFWEQTDYLNQATSKIRDLYQNCYYPGAGTGIQGTTTQCRPNAALNQAYCCNGVACAAGDVNCQKCEF